MATPPFVPTVSKFNLGDADGADLTIVLVDASQTPTRAMATVADITAEIGTGTSRVAETGAVTETGGVVEASWTGNPAPDTDGAAEIAGWWVALGEMGVTPDAGMRLLAWCPLPVAVPGTDPFPLEMPVPRLFARAGDDDTPLAALPPLEGNAGKALFTDGTDPYWGPVASVGAVGMFDSVAVADAVDGTGDEFYLIRPSLGAAVGAPIPDGWVPTAGPVDAAAVAAFLTMSGHLGDVDFLTYCDGTWGLYRTTADTLTSPWEEIAASVVVDRAGGLYADLLNGELVLRDAATTHYRGSGLFTGTPTVQDGIDRAEGTLDRDRYVAARADADVDLSDLEHATWTYGEPFFTDGNGDPVSYCNVWLTGQTDPAENGIYQVDSDWSYTLFTHPAVFDPPGNGSRRFILCPDSPDHGRGWRYIDDDPTKVQRVSSSAVPDDGQPFTASAHGSWVAIGAGGSGDGYVPTSRTVNGVTLAADRTVPNLLWRPPVHLAAQYMAADAAPVVTWASSRVLWQYVDYVNTTVAGHWIEWQLWFDAGTWDLDGFGDRGASNGVVTMKLGPYGGTLTALPTLWNQYNSTTDIGHKWTQTGINIAATGLYTLRAENTAIGTGGGGYGGRFSAFIQRRTA